MPTINTVNVIEMIENVPIQLTSFADDKDGNEQAEKIFKRMVKENGGKNKDMAMYLEDGAFLCDPYGVYLVHSS